MLNDFRTQLALPVLWSDQDAFGHVNNTVCIRWFESARVTYLEQVGLEDLMTAAQWGPILAQVTCNYRRQLKYPDNVTIGAKVTRIGNSSFTMSHAVWSEQQQAIAADGDSVVVLFDYQQQKPVRIPDDTRATIAKWDGV